MVEAGRDVRRELLSQEMMVAWTPRDEKLLCLGHHFLIVSGDQKKNRVRNDFKIFEQFSEWSATYYKGESIGGAGLEEGINQKFKF